MRHALGEAGARTASPDHVLRPACRRRTRSRSLGTRGVHASGHFASCAPGKLLAREMAEQAKCILAMDSQNKAELLTFYPESQGKIHILGTCGRSLAIP